MVSTGFVYKALFGRFFPTKFKLNTTKVEVDKEMNRLEMRRKRERE